MLTKCFSITQSSGSTVTGYFHDWYYTRKDPRNTMLYLTNLKNDIPPYHTPDVIRQSEAELAQVLRNDLAGIISVYGAMTVCGVPRSKRESSYPFSQMGLKRTIRSVAIETPSLEDGMDYIIRNTDTVCTHRARSGHGGAGECRAQNAKAATRFLRWDSNGQFVRLPASWGWKTEWIILFAIRTRFALTEQGLDMEVRGRCLVRAF